MKKLMGIFLCALMFLIIPIHLNAEDKTDLPVYKEGITQKQYNSVAITSKYNIDILTDSSERIKIQNNKNIEVKTEEFVNGLNLDNKNAEFLLFVPENLPDTSNFLFTENNYYDFSEDVETEDKQFNTLFVIVILTLSGILSCLFTLSRINRKRRKKSDVYYSYNSNKR